MTEAVEVQLTQFSDYRFADRDMYLGGPPAASGLGRGDEPGVSGSRGITWPRSSRRLTEIGVVAHDAGTGGGNAACEGSRVDRRRVAGPPDRAAFRSGRVLRPADRRVPDRRGLRAERGAGPGEGPPLPGDSGRVHAGLVPAGPRARMVGCVGTPSGSGRDEMTGPGETTGPRAGVVVGTTPARGASASWGRMPQRVLDPEDGGHQGGVIGAEAGLGLRAALRNMSRSGPTRRVGSHSDVAVGEQDVLAPAAVVGAVALEDRSRPSWGAGRPGAGSRAEAERDRPGLARGAWR